VEHDSALGSQCPRCGRPTQFVDEAYASSELLPEHTGERPHVARLGVLLDNVRSLRNTGAIFRSADALGVSLAVLAGITPTPAHPGFAKTALGAELSVP
jgi:tRNA G18 (ribose-2'-O)-methylase SpoU